MFRSTSLSYRSAYRLARTVAPSIVALAMVTAPIHDAYATTTLAPVKTDPSASANGQDADASGPASSSDAPSDDTASEDAPADGAQPGPDVAETDEAKSSRLAAEGTTAFEAGDFQNAVELFEEAYALHPKPNLMFNIGRVYEELGNLEEAEEHYAKFLTMPGVDLNTRAFAADRLEVIRRVLTQAQAEAEAEAQQPTEPPPPTPAPEETTDVPTTPPEPTSKKMPPLRIAGISTLAVGGAALVTGAILAGVSAGLVQRADDEELIPDRNELLDRARPLATSADVLFIAGGAVAVAGAVMLGVSFSKKYRQRATLAPSFGRRHVALHFSHRF